MNNNINLLGHKDKIAVPLASQKLKLLRVIAILMLFSVSSTAVILYILIYFSALPAAQQREQAALATLSQSHAEMQKIALIQDRLNGIQLVLTQRNQYEKVIDSLQKRMPPALQVDEVNISKKNATITVTSQSLDSLENFINNLVETTNAKHDYSEVILNGIVSDDTSNKFSLTVSMVLL